LSFSEPVISRSLFAQALDILTKNYKMLQSDCQDNFSPHNRLRHPLLLAQSQELKNGN